MVRVDTPGESALTGWASSSRAGRRGRFSWPCCQACRALVSRRSRTSVRSRIVDTQTVYSARPVTVLKYGR
eukprot:7345629-Prymnesium_polylepis.1